MQMLVAQVGKAADCLKYLEAVVRMSREERREVKGQEGNTCRGEETWSDG